MCKSNLRQLNRAQLLRCSVAAACLLVGLSAARAEDYGLRPFPGNLLLSRVIYDNNASNVAVGAALPPDCAPANCVKATSNGTFPFVFNNALVDGSFGITSKIVLDQLTTSGHLINSFEVPNSSQKGVGANRDQMVDSFSSKSELALNLSGDRRHVTFMGYYAPVDAVDVSNSNTPGVIDPTNPVPSAYYRVVADFDAEGRFSFTATNAYSGNNGRAAIRHRTAVGDVVFTAGNAGNGANPQPGDVILGAGAQGLAEANAPLIWQTPGLPTPVGSFNVTELGDAADKIGKDDNFRGLRIFNDVVYYTKGSGGNGVNTVYFIDTSGIDSNGKPLACPNGTGLPNPNAKLPSAPLAYNAATLQTAGLPSNMCVLKGFPTTLAKTATAFPFGIWFANATTLYVADEGDETATYDATKGVYTAAAASKTAGLQKWIFDAAAGQWNLAYTIQAGLNLGAPYTVPGYPTGANAANTKNTAPWSPGTDGLRNIVGRVNRDGTATIWAITSTVSGSGDQGADPNKLVEVVDDLKATSLPSSESFQTLRTAGFAEVLRGVSFTPGTDRDGDSDGDRDRF